MHNLKNKDKIFSISESCFDVSQSIEGLFIKKNVVNETLNKTTEYSLSNGVLIKADELWTQSNKKVICEYVNGKLLSEINLDKFGCIIFKIQCKYDSYENMILYRMDFEKGSKSKTEYLNYYNSQFQLIKLESYKNSQFEYTEDNCYNSNNSVSLKLRRNSNLAEIYKQNNYYNYFNKLHKSSGIEYENGKFVRFEYCYEYNNYGDVTVFSSNKNDINQIIKYEYKYDYQLNWIEKKFSQHDKIFKIILRKIIYQ